MNDFIKGMDISSYPEMMDRKYQYYDYDGNEVNLLNFAKEQGFNYGRLRIWNNPAGIPESKGYCSLEHTKRMAKEIVSRNLGFLLDFHYSDWWADPGNQRLPESWKGLSDEDLIDAVYGYTKEVLEQLDENGTYPDIIQIGNEIRCGMLWPAGKVSNWPMLARLINAGIRAVRDTQKDRDTRVMLHLDQGGRYYYFEEWFDNALANGVRDFDLIGLSYYPFWHGTFYDLKNTLEKLADRYHRPLILAETAHAYRKSSSNLFGEAQEKIAGFPATPQAQKKVLELIMSITAHVKNHMGLGIFYWEPFLRSDKEDGSWGTCMGVTDSEGMPTEGLRAFALDTDSVDCDAVAKVYEPKELVIPDESQLEQYLPKAVKVLKWDGRLEAQPVVWEKKPAGENILEDSVSAEGNAGAEESVIGERNISAEHNAHFRKDVGVKGSVSLEGNVSEEKEFAEKGFAEKRFCGKREFWMAGTVSPGGEKVSLKIRIESQNMNYIKNGDFSEGMDEWQLRTVGEVENDIRQEIADEFPFNTEDYFYFSSSGNFCLELGQQVKKLNRGSYTLSLEYLGDNTTGVQIVLYAKGKEFEKRQDIFPMDSEWQKWELQFELEDTADVNVGVLVDAPGIYGKIKGFHLLRME